MSDNTVPFSEVFSIVATAQGKISYSIFSLYVVNPGVFYYYLGTDIGSFLFVNMLYGNGVHIYSRPAMKKIRTCYRVIYSVLGSYMFNFSSLMVFYALGESYGDRPLLVSLLSYFIGEFMYSMFYSYLYFVDKCAFPQSRRLGSPVLDIIFVNDRAN